MATKVHVAAETDRPAARPLDRLLRHISDVPVRRRLMDMLRRAYSRLEEDETLTVVLAARRMACLHALAVTHGDLGRDAQGSVSNRVISDRFLMQFPREWWTGRHVLVLDDSVNTGRAIRRRLERLRQLGLGDDAIEVEVAVTSTSTEPYAPVRRLIDSGSVPPLRRDGRQIAELSRQFARLFALENLPYFTDFAVSQRVDHDPIVDLDEVDDAFFRFDVSSAAVSGTGGRSLVLVPREPDELLTRLPAALRSRVDLLKLRLFLSRSERGGVFARCVPIITFEPLDLDFLRTVLGRCEVPSVQNEGDARAPSAEAEALEAEELLNELAIRAGITLLDRLRDSTAGSDGDAGLWRGISCEVFRVDTHLMKLLTGLTEGQLAPLPSLGQDGEDDGARLDPRHLTAFKWPGDGSSLEELPAHAWIIVGDDIVRVVYELLRKLVTEYEDPSEPPRARLRFSLAQLAKVCEASPLAVSLAIDVLNDLGTAVPGNVWDGRERVIHRSYAPGEVDSLLPYEELPDGRGSGRLAWARKSLIATPDPDSVLPSRKRLLQARSDIAIGRLSSSSGDE